LLSPGNALFGGEFLHDWQNIFVKGAGSWQAGRRGMEGLNVPPSHSLIAPSAQRPQRLGWQASFDAALDLQTASDRLVVVATTRTAIIVIHR